MVRMAQHSTVRSQDRRDFEKFIKNFVQKAAQVIIQSRLGEKVSIPCKTKPSSTDWFNLAVPDLPDVLLSTRNALGHAPQSITHNLPITIEISLQTPDGDRMVLEYWSVNINTSKTSILTDRTLLIVYNRMGILLKSLVSETRLKPAYGLSRAQGVDSYVFCYRVCGAKAQVPSTNEVDGSCAAGVQLHLLGEGCVQREVGQIATPLGMLEVGVAYRTRMMITPTQGGKGERMMVKSDHFDRDSPRENDGDDQNSTLYTLKRGAFANHTQFQTTKDHLHEPVLIIPRVPFTKLLANNPNNPNTQTPPAETPNPELIERLQGIQEDCTNGNSPSPPRTEGIHKGENGNVVEEVVPLKNGKTKNRYTLTPTTDDFMMVDLNTPFASSACAARDTADTDSELGRFYREWQQAPPLVTFRNLPLLDEQLRDLTRQLESFEADMRQYDGVVEALQCQSPSNE